MSLSSLNPPEEVVREILREAEMYLSSQLTAGIAADQRAISFTSVLAAANVVIVGAGAGLLFSTGTDPFLGWVALGVSASLIVAMALAIMSAMPATFEFPGNSPAHWLDDLEEGKPLVNALSEQADHYAAMIQENSRLLRRNARQLRAAVWLAWSGLAAGALMVGGRFAWPNLC